MKEPEIDRSEFFRSFIRGGLLTGMGALGAALLWKSAGKPTCLDLGYCRKCPVFSSCVIRDNEE